jgi:hypothetical protein
MLALSTGAAIRKLVAGDRLKCIHQTPKGASGGLHQPGVDGIGLPGMSATERSPGPAAG